MLIADAPPDGLDGSPIQLCEVNVEQRRDHVKVFSHRQKAQESKERYFVREIRSQVKILEPFQRRGKQGILERPCQR